MRTAGCNRCRIRLGLTLAWLSLCTFSAAVSETNAPALRPLPGSLKAAPVSFDVSRLLFSPGVGDVVKMVSAGVDTGVIKAFIEQSRVSYHPTAQEIIALKKLGVANDIVVTMLAHRPRPAQNPVPWLAVGPGSESPRPEPAPAQPGLNPYAWTPPVAPFLPTYTAFGPVVSFNNSYPTFVNGRAVYAGYYLPAYSVLW